MKPFLECLKNLERGLAVTNKILAYKVSLKNGKCFIAFPSASDALEWLSGALELDEGIYSYTIEPWETTREELDKLPEFVGF